MDDRKVYCVDAFLDALLPAPVPLHVWPRELLQYIHWSLLPPDLAPYGATRLNAHPDYQGRFELVKFFAHAAVHPTHCRETLFRLWGPSWDRSAWANVQDLTRGGHAWDTVEEYNARVVNAHDYYCVLCHPGQVARHTRLETARHRGWPIYAERTPWGRREMSPCRPVRYPPSAPVVQVLPADELEPEEEAAATVGADASPPEAPTCGSRSPDTPISQAYLSGRSTPP